MAPQDIKRTFSIAIFFFFFNLETDFSVKYFATLGEITPKPGCKGQIMGFYLCHI